MERLLDGFADDGLERVLALGSDEFRPAGDAIGAVRELRARDGEALQVTGSASMAAQLIAHGLADEYRLMIEPVLLGAGKRLFPDDGSAQPLEPVSATTAATGVLICTYRPADR
jgi:dihydrofolate reductase